jgi:hypothetical protein
LAHREPSTPSRKITRRIHEAARDVARAIAKTKAYEVTRRGELELSAVGSTQPKPIEPQNALQMREQHLDLLAQAPRGHCPKFAPPGQAHGTSAASARPGVRCVSVLRSCVPRMRWYRVTRLPLNASALPSMP